MAQLVKHLAAVWEAGFSSWAGKLPWRREQPPIPVFGHKSLFTFSFLSRSQRSVTPMWTLYKEPAAHVLLSSIPLLNLIPLRRIQRKIIFGITANTPSLSHPSSSFLSHFHLSCMCYHFLRIKGNFLGFASIAWTSIFYLSSQSWLPLCVRSTDSC